MVCSRNGGEKKRGGGFRFISANALNLETRFRFDEQRQRSRLHNENGQKEREDTQFVWTLGRSIGTDAQKFAKFALQANQEYYYDFYISAYQQPGLQ